MSQHKSIHAAGQHAADAVSDVTQNAQDAITGAATAAAQMARSVAHRADEALDDSRGTAAHMLAHTASSIHDGAAHLPGGERVTSAADAAAEGIDVAASYVRKHTTRQMLADLQRLMRRHPEASLLIAAAVGVVVGRSIRK
jgi:ElaB/YqjD/DUF883 family membrane-anchored ribosome-binding protein